MQASRWIYMNGDFVPYEKAVVHVMAPVVKYGASVFEGICAYSAESGEEAFVFRCDEHLVRLQNSMRILRFDAAYEIDALREVVCRTVARNDLRADAHIRLSVWIDGDGTMERAGPVGIMCAATARPPRSLDGRATSAAISSWRRIDDRSMPPRVKSAANYANGRLAQMQAKADGYGEALLIGVDGKIAEGTGACFFMIRDGVAVTPPVTAGILESVTRATLLELLPAKLGCRVEERAIDRTEAYVAEEAFLCGSGYEITPLTSIDRLPVGTGKVGPVTRSLWDAYERVVRGGDTSYRNWLSPVFGAAEPARRAAAG